MSKLSQTAVANGKTYVLGGFLGGAQSFISWTGSVTDTVTGYSGDYTAYYGSIDEEAGLFPGVVWANAMLTALGAPSHAYGLANWTGKSSLAATDVISYQFSSPVPAGQSFLLWDVGAYYQGVGGPYAFQVSAKVDGAAVSTAGWSFQVLSPNNTIPGSRLSINAASGAITVNSYPAQTSVYPDTVIVITPNAPIDSLSVSGQTIAYDLWGLALPNLPGQILFEALGPGAAGSVSTWQMNDTAVVGGGAIGYPGVAWTWEGDGGFYAAGENDILWRNQNGDLWLWRVLGTTITASAPIGNPGGSWNVVGLGDVNGDGTADIVFRNATGMLAVWEMNGASVVGGGTIGDPGPSWTLKGIGDFNGDGQADLLFENTSGVFATWLLNGSYVIGGATLGAVPGQWAFQRLADFNGDGVADLLFENVVTGQYAGWEIADDKISGLPAFGAPGAAFSVKATGSYTTAGTSGVLFENSLTGDYWTWDISDKSITGGGDIGNPGLAYAVSTVPPAARPELAPAVYFTDASGNVQSWNVARSVATPGASFAAPAAGLRFAAAGDFDGNGYADFLFQADGGALTMELTDGTNVTSTAVIGSPGSGWFEYGVGDFNGDGRSDIVFTDDGGNIEIWNMDGTTVLNQVYIARPAGWGLAGIGDFNGDGTSDLLFRQSDNYTPTFALWDMSLNQYVNGGAIGSLPNYYWYLEGVGDFNGDGKSDLLFLDPSSGNYYTWDLNGSAIVGGGLIGNPGSNWLFKGVADVAGNHLSAILFQNTSTGQLATWQMNDTRIVAGGGVLGTPTTGWTFQAFV
jgi:hypothetical protein